MFEEKVSCWKCAREFPVAKVKVDLKNSSYICLECLRGDFVKKSVEGRKSKPLEREIPLDRQNKKCNNCSYAYRFDALKKYPPHCPNCGKKETLF
jgi:hypothetical protein